MKNLRDGLILVAVLMATPTLAATVNGDFSDGLTGYTASADTNLSGPQDPDGFVGIGDNAGNSYGQLTTDPELEALVLFITLRQQFTVTADTPLFSFDFGTVFDQPNTIIPSGFVPSFNSDRFSVQIRDLDAAGTISDLGLYTLLDRTRTGTVLDPFGNSSAFDMVLGTSSDPFFDASLTADLSSLVGRNLEVSFGLRDFFDGRQTSYGVENIQLTEGVPAAVVPLPASVWFLLAGFGALGCTQRRRTS